MSETHLQMEKEHKQWEQDHKEWKEKITQMRADHYKALSTLKIIEAEVMTHEAGFVKTLQEIESHSHEISQHRHEWETHIYHEDKELHQKMEHNHENHSANHKAQNEKLKMMQGCHTTIMKKLEELNSLIQDLRKGCDV